MRDVLARAGRADDGAQLAVDMYVHRLRHYIGAYRALLPELQALVFTGGVGEHAPAIRSAACRDLMHLGLHLDENKNQTARSGLAEIQSSLSAVKIMVVATDEEGEIARQVLELISR
jgi:acetate kinase